MANLILLSTPKTRAIPFPELYKMGVNIDRPILSKKTHKLLGYKFSIGCRTIKRNPPKGAA